MKDFTKQIDVLVRLGILPIQDLPYLNRALLHVRSDMWLPIKERQVFYRFVEKLMKVCFDSPALLRLIMNKTGSLRRESLEEKRKYIKKTRFPKGDTRIDTTKSNIGDIEKAPPTGYEERDMANIKKLIEHVRERNGKFVVTNEAGNKTLGTHGTRKAAVKQLQAIEISKHARGESVDHGQKSHQNFANLKGMNGSCATSGKNCSTCGYDSDENSHRTSVNVKESIDLIEEINLRKVSSNTLQSLANAPTSKKKAGGHITSHDKQLASAAKRELLRRKHMGESVDYTERFNAALEHFNVTDTSDFDIDTMKDFLAYVDTQNESVISANSQKRLQISDKHKERAAEDMLARQHMKDRLMKAASSEYQSHINTQKGTSAARALFKKDLKKASVSEEAGTVLDTSPNVVLAGAKIKSTKKNKLTQGHSGKKE